MISDDEARKLAEEIADEDSTGRINKLAHKLIELLDRQRWIPVMEKMPDTERSILVHGGVAYFDGDSWRTLTGFNYPGPVIRWKVTHWMPLPQPPEQQP